MKKLCILFIAVCLQLVLFDSSSKDKDSSGNNNGGGESPTIFGAPTNVRATANSSSVTVTWSSVPDAIGYYVYRSNSSSGSYSFKGYTESTQYTDNYPYDGENYYKVTAVRENSEEESDYSNYASCYFDGNGGGGGGGTTVPDAPTNVSANANSSSVSISWYSVSGADSYVVYRSSSSSGSYAQITTSYSTSATDSNPLDGYNYYKVTAKNNSGESSKSNYAYCNFEGSGGGGGTTVPDAPTGVSAVFSGSTAVPSVTISWNSVSGATSYKIYRSRTAGGTYSQLGNAVNYTTACDYDPMNGDNYYKIKAVNSAGSSTYSDYAYCSYNANAYSPCPVNYGNCTANSSTITLRWTIPSSSGCGTPTKQTLRAYEPYYGAWGDVQVLSGSATSVSFNYSAYKDSDGWVKMGIVSENDYGTDAKQIIYNADTGQWIKY